MKISNAEFGTSDMNRQVNFATTTQVLDITVSSVFRSSWNCTRALVPDLFFRCLVCASGMAVLRQGRQGNVSLKLVGSDELGFPLIPRCEYFRGWCAAQNTRMDEASELHVRNVSRGAVDSFKVPNCFGTLN